MSSNAVLVGEKRTENFKTFSVLLLSVGNAFFLISKTVLKNTHHRQGLVKQLNLPVESQGGLTVSPWRDITQRTMPNSV